MLINRRFGDYILVKKIGAGGMAEIFLAIKRGLGQYEKLVALKMIMAGRAEQPEYQRMFQTEAEIAARFNHPHVVQLYDVVRIDGVDAMVMEYMPGHTLDAVLHAARRQNRELPLDLALWIVREACEGLHYVHTVADWDGTPLAVIHRDISPENLMITYGGVTKVFDFGIARSILELEDHRSGSMAGKIAYMSPEQCRSQHLEPSSDVFSLGVVLWELTTGQRLFQRDNQILAIQALTEEPIPRPGEVKPGYPRFLERVVMKALERDPRKRYQDCAELRAELSKFLKVNALKPERAHMLEFMSELFAQEKIAFEELISEARALPPLPAESSMPSRPSAPRARVPEPPSMSSPSMSPPSIPGGSLDEDLLQQDIEAALRAETRREEDQARRALDSFVASKPPPTPMEAPPTPLPAPVPVPVQVGGGSRLPWLIAAVGVLFFVASVGVGGYVWHKSQQAPAPQALPQATAGSLALSTTPSDARIYLDGRLLSIRTPETLPGLPFDQKTIITLEKEGFQPVQREVTLTREAPLQSLELTLEPLKEQGQGQGSVRVTATPPDVQVYIDNINLTELTPALLKDISAGVEHSLRLSRDGYRDEIFSFTLSQGEVREFDVELTQADAEALATLSLSSEPSRARVTIDGEYIGDTNLEGLKLPSETPLDVKVELPGVGTWSRVVVLGPGENRQMRAALGLAAQTEKEEPTQDEAAAMVDAQQPDPLKGKARLSISSQPPTQVHLGGRPVGQAPVGELALKPGRYLVEFRDEARHISYTQRISLQADEARDLNVAIPQGTVTVQSDAPSQVEIDGQPVGQAPVEAHSLYAGLHVIRVISQDGRKRDYRLRIRGEDTRRIQASFAAPKKAEQPEAPTEEGQADPAQGEDKASPAVANGAQAGGGAGGAGAKQAPAKASGQKDQDKPKKPKSALDDEPYPLLK